MKNPFETGKRKIIPATLVYLESKDQILMMHRNSKKKAHTDIHHGKWNGLGGKCEENESPIEAAQREVKEESGLDLPLSTFHVLGLIQLPNFIPDKNEDWIVFICVGKISPQWISKINPHSLEGELHWIERKKIPSLNLWPGDHYFISHVLALRPFFGTLWYEQKRVSRHWIQPCSHL